MRCEPTHILLDAIIRQDKLRLSEIHEGLCKHPDVDVWAFHRWEKVTQQFKLIYPRLTTVVPFPADFHAVLENKKCFVDNNLSRSYGEWAETRQYPVTLILPLFYNSELMGLMQGFSSQSLETCKKAVKLLNPKLRVLAQGWHLIGLLEEKERIAFTDSLTGLFNSKFLLHFLKAELARCARYKKSVAVLFIDIDFFKRVNDVYGHLVGSSVLNELGKLIRSHVREADTVARYGGDEYVVVLTEIAQDEAFGIAERLRKTVGAFRFCQRNSLSVQLTISAGVAAFPENGRTADELIHRADTAMYEAKRSNRNCVKVAV